jgi:hypothetical protein
MLYTSNTFATTTTALPYAEIVKAYALNAAGQSITDNALTILQLDSTPHKNSIDGLAVASNQISIPTGTYSIEAQTVIASATAQTTYSSAYLWDATNSTIIASGLDGSAVWSTGVAQAIKVCTQLTVSTATLMEFKVVVRAPGSGDVYVARTTTGAAFSDSTANLDHRTKVKIWKLA